MVHLRSVELRSGDLPEGYPFALPIVAEMGRLELRSPVTLFVGENGTGKSTILEAIAAAAGSPAIGGADVRSDETLADARRLAEHLRLTWTKRTHRGFFLRAEDVFNFGRRMSSLVREMDALVEEYDERFDGYGLSLARGSALEERRRVVERYGEDLHARSHGESFLQIFAQRFVPGGLYLLDEPDTPLSPQRQLALLSLLREMTAKDAQFIVATHSPILMGFPGATILSFDGETITELPYGEIEAVRLMRAFLDNPEAFLRHL